MANCLDPLAVLKVVGTKAQDCHTQQVSHSSDHQIKASKSYIQSSPPDKSHTDRGTEASACPSLLTGCTDGEGFPSCVGLSHSPDCTTGVGFSYHACRLW